MTSLTIRSDDGLNLEAELETPEAPRAALLMCHAHPAMQGTMNSPLLLALRDAALAREIAVLRFNFRGVGASEGRFGTGIAEVADASGALAHLAATVRPVPVAVVGWSFGAAVAVRLAAAAPDLACCVAVAPAIEKKADITDGLPPAAELGLTVPTLVVVGSNDRHTPPDRCKVWADDAGARYVEINAANHFFWAKYEPLVTEAIGFVADHALG